MPRNWQFKPPKIGQYKAPAVEIALVRSKNSFSIKKRHDARILIEFLKQKFTLGTAKNKYKIPNIPKIKKRTQRQSGQAFNL